MLAMIVGEERTRSGAIPLALVHAGFDARETFTTDEADLDVSARGAEKCVLVIEADAFDSRAGSAAWASFLHDHPRVPAVIVAPWTAGPEARAVASEPHRILLEDPFDAAAVVAAARRACSTRRSPLRRLREQTRRVV